MKCKNCERLEAEKQLFIRGCQARERFYHKKIKELYAKIVA